MNKLPFAFPLADDDIFRRRATDFNGTLRCGQWILRCSCSVNPQADTFTNAESV